MGCHASTAATQPTPPTPNGRHGGLKTGSATPAVWAAPPPGTDGAERHRHRWPGGKGGGQRRHERPTGSVKTGRKGTQNGLFGNAKQAGREYETARPALPELTIRTWQDGEMNHWGARPGKQVRRLAARRDAGAKSASRDFGMHWGQGHCAAMCMAPGTRLTWACWWPPGARRQVALAGLPQPCRRPLPCRPALRARSPCQT